MTWQNRIKDIGIHTSCTVIFDIIIIFIVAAIFIITIISLTTVIYTRYVHCMLETQL